MAPVKPRRTARAKVARSKSQLGKYAPPSPTGNSPDEVLEDSTAGAEMLDDDFGFGVGLKLNKKDKRSLKRNTLLNRVREAGISKDSKAKKRRRPAKKLKTDISGLEDVLPDVEGDGEWEGISGDEDMDENPGMRKARRKKEGATGKMEMKSLKHKPGAMKKKFEMEGRERERFGKNLAGLMSGKGGDEGQGDRWAALRSFIGGTMERDAAFARKA